jgi:N-acetylglucosamine-6-sulfatase
MRLLNLSSLVSTKPACSTTPSSSTPQTTGTTLASIGCINVPLVVRGPGVPAQRITRAPSSHTDLAPTLLTIAGVDIHDKKFDGSPIDIYDVEAEPRSEHVAVEFWGFALAESIFGRENGPPFVDNNTYKGLRIEAEDYGFYYSVWCSNEKELYDMKVSQLTPQVSRASLFANFKVS